MCNQRVRRVLVTRYSQNRYQRSVGPWSGLRRRPLPQRRAWCTAAAAVAEGGQAAGHHTALVEGRHTVAAVAGEDSPGAQVVAAGSPSAAAGAGIQAGHPY
jgi:hypothetical protein